jgi:hypothetical protein
MFLVNIPYWLNIPSSAAGVETPNSSKYHLPPRLVQLPKSLDRNETCSIYRGGLQRSLGELYPRQPSETGFNIV